MVLLSAGCGGGDGPPVLPLTATPGTTLQAIWEPLAPPPGTLADMDSGALTLHDHAAFAAAGLGVRLGPGLPWQERRELAPDFAPGAPGARRSLAYLWQAADPQVIDEESPIRLEAFDILYRPNGHLSPQVWDAHVQTARRLSRRSGRPFDFALLAGDLTDGAQRNELAWTLGVLAGGDVDPDSGRDDDPVPGAGNDFNDPFHAPGLGRPWYPALGNHDANYNGGFDRVTEGLRAAAAGGEIYDFPLFPNGFCDGADPDAALVTEGRTPPDPDRIPLRRAEVLAALQDAPGSPPGHGLSPADAAAGRGYYSAHPLGDRPLRLLVLDTLNDLPEQIGEGSQGWCDEAQFAWLENELDAARAAGELVLVLSHHRPEDFAERSPVSGATLAEALAARAEVVLHLTGHGHADVARLVQPASGTGGHWQLMAASPVDFPQQSRIVELVDEGNGFLSIYVTNLDHDAPEGSLAHRARELAAAKLYFTQAAGGQDVADFWAAELQNQNLLLRLRLPEPVRASLARFDWPARVESEETLAALSGP
ncbi:MAG TPA: metallophosphoesterase [Myxococcota bacterium]|nr:metallophosphoesterase [Myxococcota bacterium]HRY92806.1 metallophosphoesterase [Myxococcota bacterium]